MSGHFCRSRILNTKLFKLLVILVVFTYLFMPLGSSDPIPLVKASNQIDLLPDDYIGVWRGSAVQVNPNTQWTISLAITKGDISTIVGTAGFPSVGCGAKLTLLTVQTASVELLEDVVYGNCWDMGTITLAPKPDGSLEYRWRSPDNLSSAIGTVTRVSSGQTNLPDTYVGVWEGSAVQVNPPAQWPILMTLIKGDLGTIVGIAGFAPYRCGAELTLSTVNTSFVELLEDVTYGSCWDLGTITLTPQPDGTLQYQWRSPDNVSSAIGSVKKISAAAGGGIDLSIDSVIPVQVLEGQDLVKDKATAIKVVVRKTGSQTVSNVPVAVYLGPATYTQFYVADSAKMNSNNALVQDNQSYPLSFSEGDSIKTIYFVNLGLTPSGGTFQVTATVDPNRTIPEMDETNNTTVSPPLPVHDTLWSGSLFPDLYIHYFRTDWRSTAIGVFDNFADYSDRFLSGVYPVSAQRYTPHRSTDFLGDTSLYWGPDGRLNQTELGLWVLNTLTVLKLAHPTTDRFISVVPEGWFGYNTTGTLTQAAGVAYPAMRDLVISEARNISRPNGPSIAAHEIGHSYGLDLGCEEYNSCNPTRQDSLGNYAAAGIWVDQRIPIQVPNARNTYCFMGAYSNNEYWIDANDYSKLLNDHKASNGVLTNSLTSANQAILAVGTFDITGTVTLNNWYVLPDAATDALTPGPYMFEYQDGNGQVLFQQSFDVSFKIDTGFDNGENTLEQSPFAFTIPYVPGTSKIVVKQNSTRLAEKTVSAHSPVVQLISPNGNEKYDKQVTIQWTASDVDGDAMSYTILFSQDNGITWEPITTDMTATNYLWDVSRLIPGEQYRIKVIVTDGFNTGEDVSDAPFTILGHIFLPLLH